MKPSEKSGFDRFHTPPTRFSALLPSVGSWKGSSFLWRVSTSRISPSEAPRIWNNRDELRWELSKSHLHSYHFIVLLQYPPLSIHTDNLASICREIGWNDGEYSWDCGWFFTFHIETLLPSNERQPHTRRATRENNEEQKIENSRNLVRMESCFIERLR